MKHIVLSAVAIATLATVSHANEQTELAALKTQMAAMMKKIEMLEAKQVTQAKEVKQVKQTVASKKTIEVAAPKQEGISAVKSKAPVLEFSGTHYLGFVSSKADADRNNRFETRRNYLQVKAFFAEDSKDYLRLTLDTFQNTNDTYGADNKISTDNGSWEARVKYAFLYLDNVLPNTGVELGQAHRPWIDYEEHGAWNYRSISKVFVEDSNAADFTNSADLGVNFKTKTPYFTSELGLFNGEGYHAVEDGAGLSAEWRLTGHLLGTGKEKRKSHVTYADVSFFGQQNSDFAKKGDLIGHDFNWYGFHAVYNQPEFLLAAQYVATSDAGAKYAGDGWSVNGEYRLMENWNALAKYDNYSLDSKIDKKRTIAGIAYEYNKNVELIANWQRTDITGFDVDDALMLTACIEW